MILNSLLLQQAAVANLHKNSILSASQQTFGPTGFVRVLEG